MNSGKRTSDYHITLKMSRSTLFLFACSTLIAVAFGEDLQLRKALRPVPGVDEQCKARGFFGACFDWVPEENWITNPDKCRSLKCAKRISGRPYIILEATEPALDGTRCGHSKICRGGACVEVSKNEIPENQGSGEKWYCTVVDSKSSVHQV